MVKPVSNFAVFRVFLLRNGEAQNFFSDTKVFVKLSSGKKFEIPCIVEDGDLWLGNEPKEWNAILDILNKGNFILVIQSKNMFGDRMTCTFNIGKQTTGIKTIISQ